MSQQGPWVNPASSKSPPQTSPLLFSLFFSAGLVFPVLTLPVCQPFWCSLDSREGLPPALREVEGLPPGTLCLSTVRRLERKRAGRPSVSSSALRSYRRCQSSES